MGEAAGSPMTPSTQDLKTRHTCKAAITSVWLVLQWTNLPMCGSSNKRANQTSPAHSATTNAKLHFHIGNYHQSNPSWGLVLLIFSGAGCYHVEPTHAEVFCVCWKYTTGIEGVFGWCMKARTSCTNQLSQNKMTWSV